MPFEFNIITAILANILGVYLLCKGADWLVDGSVSLANKAGVSKLIVGLTVVSIGTSAPEAASSIVAAVNNTGSIALGNIFGSNIANIALIGGLCAIIRPMVVSKRVFKVELSAMNIIMIALIPFIWNYCLGRVEGIILVAVFATLLYLLIYKAKNGDEVIEVEEVDFKEMALRKSITLVSIGLLALIIGAKLAVDGAVYLGKAAGLSEAVIGLTIIAIGTSLPELITCVTASLKGHDDISVGNLIGSNIFNVLLVGGVASVVKPLQFDHRLLKIDYPVMLVTGIAFYLLAVKGSIGRSKGILLLSIYLAYTAYCIFSK